MTDYSAMTNRELNEASAIACGKSIQYKTPGGSMVVIGENDDWKLWLPAEYLDQASSFLFHFLAAHPLFQVTETTLIVQVDGVQVRHWQVVLWRGLAPSGVEFHAVDKSKARAETIAVLRAWKGTNATK